MLIFDEPEGDFNCVLSSVEYSGEFDLTPEISEFSYGFALTNELVGWAPLAVAPVFPSLIEEGRPGGGYDVRLDFPALALFLQFKRSDCMKRRSAKEFRDYDLNLCLPFYRFKITERSKSNQHDMLLALDEGTNAVFYAAPLFHEISEIDNAWTDNSVASQSIFVSPSAIGQLDDGPHHVAFDEFDAFVCSEPRNIDFLSGVALAKRLAGQLKDDDRPLRERIPEFRTQLVVAERRAADMRREREGSKAASDGAMHLEPFLDLTRDPTPTLSRVPTRVAESLSEPNQTLRDIADQAARKFNAQFILVQQPS